MAGDRPARRACAIYTRKSSEEGLEQEFNSLDAQREACGAFIESQRHEGWRPIRDHYDDGGYSGGSMDRPALRKLLQDIEAGEIDVVVVYKVDRLTRSLADFAKIVEIFDRQGVSFVSVTQQFNTTSSMGRLTLNVLLSFAQFEREVTGERIRDKIAASRAKGMWMGGMIPLGYDLKERKLVVNAAEAAVVRRIFERYAAHDSVAKLKAELDGEGVSTKAWIAANGRRFGGTAFARGALYKILHNRLYLGETVHRGKVYAGEHQAIVETELWDRVHQQLRLNGEASASALRGADPSPLAGLIFDSAGNRMSPSHAVKGGKRYRYYVSQALLQFRAEKPAGARRVPAYEIERLVAGRIRALFADPAQVIKKLARHDEGAAVRSHMIKSAARFASAWDDMDPSRATLTTRACVRRVAVGDGEITIVLRRSQIRALLDGGEPSRSPVPVSDGQSDDDVQVKVSARLRRCGMETKLIVEDSAVAGRPAAPDLTLLKALARATIWNEQFLSGSVRSLREIGQAEGISERYVSWILNLAYLAPDITNALVDGRQPPSLTLQRLIKGVPIVWDEQRRAWAL